MWMGLVLGLQHPSMMGGVTLHMYFIVVCGSLLLLVKIIHNLILHSEASFFVLPCRLRAQSSYATKHSNTHLS